MKLILLYTNNTPADRDIAYLQKRLTDVRIPLTLIDADSRDGISYTELYDATQRPALLAIDGDGRLVQIWQGSVPSLSEVQGIYGVAP